MIATLVACITALAMLGVGATPPVSVEEAGVLRVILSPTPAPNPWHTVLASSYGIGDGFLGGRMACGGRLTSDEPTVAYRYLHTSRAVLRCGDQIRIRLAGSKGIGTKVTVTDAGPFVGNRVFDLGPAACRSLRACGVPIIQWRKAP